jgi:hypothetical protein
MSESLGWESERPLVANIGHIVRGVIDTLLTQTCKHLYEELSGHPSQKEPPRELSRRLRFIKKCFNSKSELKHLSSMASNLCSTINDISWYRDFFVHGCMTEWDLRLSTFQFTRLDRREDNSGYDQTSTTVTTKKLIEIAAAAGQVVFGLGDLGEGLRELIANQQLGKKR